MLNLVKKEFKISKSWIFLLFLSIIFAFSIFVSMHGTKVAGIKFIQNMIYSYAVFMLAYISVIDNIYHDIKNKSEVILNSLPVSRGDIVRGKYLILIVYIIIYSLSMGLVNKIFMPLIYGGESQLQILWSLITIGTISLIFYSIYYPLYFKSEDGLMTFNQVFRILIIVFPSALGKFSKKLPMNKILNIITKVKIERIGIFLLVLAFIVYYISLQISKKIYMKKEFL